MEQDKVDVEVTVEVEPESDTGSTDDVTTSHIIDAAVESGIAAERAADDAGDAQIAAIDADIARGSAEHSADRAETAASETAQLVGAMQELTRTNAELLAAMQARQSGDLAATVSELPDAEVLNPEVDIAPESSHWLTKRWGAGLFGKRA